MVDMTQLTGSYAASWLPWIMIPLIFYILPFPVFALVFLWIEKEGSSDESPRGKVPRTVEPVNADTPYSISESQG
jgi:photosystem I subunit VIII